MNEISKLINKTQIKTFLSKAKETIQPHVQTDKISELKGQGILSVYNKALMGIGLSKEKTFKPLEYTPTYDIKEASDFAYKNFPIKKNAIINVDVMNYINSELTQAYNLLKGDLPEIGILTELDMIPFMSTVEIRGLSGIAIKKGAAFRYNNKNLLAGALKENTELALKNALNLANDDRFIVPQDFKQKLQQAASNISNKEYNYDDITTINRFMDKVCSVLNSSDAKFIHIIGDGSAFDKAQNAAANPPPLFDIC